MGSLISNETFTDFDLSNSTDSAESDECEYYPQDYLTEKFFLITVFGSLVAVTGIFNNCLLIRVFTRSALIKTHVFYLCVLAVCDIVTETSYILIMSFQILFDYAQLVSLYRLWHNYVRSMFTLTQVAMTLATYMIVSASGERFVATLKWLKRRTCTSVDRSVVTAIMFCFALFSKGTIFWELEVIYNENCTGFGAYGVAPSQLARNDLYRVAFVLWFRHIVHVFLPFFLLLLLNGTILLHLKRNPMEMHSALISLTLGDLVRQRKKSIRAATIMLAAMVTTYLVSNLLNVIFTIWEHVDKVTLVALYDGRFYTFSADVISLLTVVTGTIRLPIYCACNKQLRKEIGQLVGNWRQNAQTLSGSFKRCFVSAKLTKHNSQPMFTGAWEREKCCVDDNDNENHTLINGQAEFIFTTPSVEV